MTEIKNILLLLNKFVSFYDMKSVFLGGDACLSIFLNKPVVDKKIEILCPTNEIAVHIGELFSSEILEKTSKIENNRLIVQVDDFDLIFQSDSLKYYMKEQEIQNWMKSKEIDDVPLMSNVYGRDFTINTLLFSLNSGQFYDPTGQAISDIEDRVLRTVLPCEMIIKFDPLICIKALKFSLQHDYFIESDFRLMLDKGLSHLDTITTTENIVKELIDILKIDSVKGLEMIKRYKLDKFIIAEYSK